MKKLLGILLLGSLCLSTAAFAADSWTGTVTDKNCANKPGNSAECAKRCIERDGKAYLVTDTDRDLLPIENVDAIKGHEGHHVKLTGSMTDDKSIHVDKVEMVKAEKSEK